MPDMIRPGRARCPARSGLVFLALLVLVAVPVAAVRVAESAETATVIAIDAATSTLTVRDDTTGRTSQFRIPDPVALQSFRVGQVLDGSPAASSKLATRGAQLPPIRAGSDSPQDCVVRCLNAPGTTYVQCVYWCRTR